MQPAERDPPPEGYDPAGQKEAFNVTDIHTPLMREQDDPRDGFEAVPPWMTIVFGGLLFWGGFYMSRYSGDFSGSAFDGNWNKPVAGGFAKEKPIDPKTVYNNCVACHQANGQGNPSGGVPPLAGSEWVVGGKIANQPLPGETARLVRILLQGLQGPVNVKGTTWPGSSQMPPWGAQLKDAQIAAVLTHIRGNGEWGNGAPPVTAEMVAAVRAATKGRSRPWTMAELYTTIPDDFSDLPPAGKEKDKDKDKAPSKEK
jgi:mono/diheme cytochrome c family protein